MLPRLLSVFLRDRTDLCCADLCNFGLIVELYFIQLIDAANRCEPPFWGEGSESSRGLTSQPRKRWRAGAACAGCMSRRYFYYFRPQDRARGRKGWRNCLGEGTRMDRKERNGYASCGCAFQRGSRGESSWIAPALRREVTSSQRARWTTSQLQESGPTSAVRSRRNRAATLSLSASVKPVLAHWRGGPNAPRLASPFPLTYGTVAISILIGCGATGRPSDSRANLS